ncbi:MAG: phosphatase PAP2 family protein [Rhodothermales bacterium]|nr:phosphatase PAP2 family protein [Rhodothermales bacterium]
MYISKRKILDATIPSTPLDRPVHIASLVRRIGAVLIALLLTVPPDAEAQLSSRSDPLRFIEYLRDDFTAAGPAFLTGSPLVVVGVSSAVVVTSRYDATLQDRAERYGDVELVRIVNEFGDVRTVRPFTVLVFAGSLMQPDERVQDAAFTSLEAVIMSNIVTGALKALFGRARPYQDEGAGSFEPFSGNTSFPSGHATTAFAFLAPWIMYYPGPLIYGAAGIAGGTALARLSLRFHWPSDVVAGAAIGSLTGIWLARRHLGHSGATRIRPVAGPGTVGLRVVW